MRHIASIAGAILLFASLLAYAQPANALPASVEASVQSVLPRMIAWRRDIHQHPELGNREVRTARLVARHLRSLRLDDVRTGIAHTGVVGVLHGAGPGPVIALRADMDALPVTEQVDIPFASRVRTTYNGQDVGVMHACGHDTHVAILMAAAEILAQRRSEFSGTVLFVFQPAEEGPPPGEDGGAELMLEQGVFADLRPEAMFGLHATNSESGKIFATAGPIMASSDALRIIVRGRQTHAARPHEGIDPITVAAQIVTALQLIPTRQFDAVNSPVVISIGQIQGGVRRNIIPDQVEMHGTVRVLNATTHDDVLSRIRRTAEQVAASAGAEVEVEFSEGNPVLVNDTPTTERALNALRAALGEDAIVAGRPIMAAEDFAFFADEVPSFYFNFGVNAPGVTDAAPNHSPHFYVHEPALETGLRGMLAVVLDRIGASGRHGGGEQ